MCVRGPQSDSHFSDCFIWIFLVLRRSKFLIFHMEKRKKKKSGDFHLGNDLKTPDTKLVTFGLDHLMGSFSPTASAFETSISQVGYVWIQSGRVWVNHSPLCFGPLYGFLCVPHCVQRVPLSPGDDSRPADKQQHKPAGVTKRISYRGLSSCLTGHTITSHLMFWNSKGFSVNSGWCEKLYSSVELFQFIGCYLPNQQSHRLFLIFLFSCSASQGHWVTRKEIILIFFRGCGVISC